MNKLEDYKNKKRSCNLLVNPYSVQCTDFQKSVFRTVYGFSKNRTSYTVRTDFERSLIKSVQSVPYRTLYG